MNSGFQAQTGTTYNAFELNDPGQSSDITVLANGNANQIWVAPSNGVVQKLFVGADALPDVTESLVCSLQVNGATSSLAVTLDHTHQSAANNTFSVSVSQGDRLCLKNVVTNLSLLNNIYAAAQFVPQG